VRVLGIDPGLAIVGYGLIEEIKSPKGTKDYRVIEAGVIRTPAGEPDPTRLATIYEELSCLIAESKPEAMAVERLFFYQNVTTAMAVSQARGVILLAGHKLPIAGYTPLEVKRQICGYGRAGKGQIQAMIQRLLRLKTLPKPDDAADALAVALCHLLRQRGNENVPRIGSSRRRIRRA
jgi:crossover junction endodeoxyribonuclease RuvC